MATRKSFAVMFSVILINLAAVVVESQRFPPDSAVLTPPYFNLAYQRRIEATATCGEGNVGQEQYCKLTGADPTAGENEIGNVIQGQLCDICISSDLAEQLGTQYPQRREYYLNRVHSPENAVDGSESWWQSPPLSRGLQYNEVNLTVDLGQVFHVAYVFIKMANSPRPGVWALERSTDFGETWQPWQYFADTVNDCYQFFGGEGGFTTSIERDDSVICTTHYSTLVPLENGEVAVSLVNGRPSAYNFSYSPVLQEWTKATNVRLRLVQTQTLFGQLMAVRVDQDPTVTRRYFYSIKDISIGGRCVCNGHADVCNQYGFGEDRDQPRLVCQCQHNTCGDQCEVCCPGFVQKPWRPATPYSSNECEPCQCYGHTNECVYDPDVARQRLSVDVHGNYDGGGRCVNCRHNTEGINCEKCVKGYYHPDGVRLDSRDACQPCNCDLVFSTGECDASGRCFCRPQYTGLNCERCAYGYMSWPECVPCECNLNGTQGGVCEARAGRCPCKPEFAGDYCDRCAPGYFNFPRCERCNCNSVGVLDGSCNQRTGQCVCKNNYGGTSCEECAPGYYNYPACNLCECDPGHTTAEICDVYTGTCLCQENFSGLRCDRCEAGYHRYPYCIDCGCQEPGSVSSACDMGTGQCRCRVNFAGQYCDKCAPGYYQYPDCKECDCDTYGSYGKSCDQLTGQCDCRPTFMGQRCSDCRPNFYNYPNCEECNCNPDGAVPVPGYPLGGCGSVNQGVLCECKANVMGRICDMCRHGYWQLDRNNPDGCSDCGCHRDGTTGGQNLCDTQNGQCVCRTFTQDRRCDQCADGTYNLQGYNHFGCEDCACDVGGAVDHSCNKETGACTCRPRIGGAKCNEPISTHYFPTLYQHKYELEEGRTIRGGPVRYGYDDIFPGYSWRGYAVLSRIQDEVLIDIDISRPTLFRVVYHFVNRNTPTVTGEVSFTSASPGLEPQTATVYFPATDGNPAYATASTPVYLTTGRWTVSLKSPKTLFVDYMVLVPREYYEASVLQQPVYRVCKLPDDGRLCQHYVYVDVSSHPTAQGSQGYVRRGQTRDNTQLFPKSNINKALGVTDMAYLDSQQTDISMSIPMGMSGKYYLVLQYFSDVEMRTQSLDVDISSSGSRGDRGKLHLSACPYSSLCRQVVVDENGDAKLFEIGGAFASATLSGQVDVDVAVDSVVLIPARMWDLEIIQPRLKCIRRNGQCLESEFQVPTGAVKTQFEEGPNRDLVADDMPPNIIDTSVKVVKLNGRLPIVNVKASVDRPGPHVFVVHYFQPFEIGFDVNVEVIAGLSTASADVIHTNGVYNRVRGSFRANYCPGVSGCRAAISFDEDSLNGEVLDLSDLNFVLTFNNSAARPIWLDYVMVVPAPQFSAQVLHVRPVDKSAEFISECAQDNFNIDTTTTGFCRDSVFSLTAEYNNGAFACDCNTDGSRSFSCQPFGGQCSCKPNVIGRDCSRCRTGHYRFPDCLECNCPSGLCDDETGQCMCPPRVTGYLCDECEPLTFGFDPLIGCEDCDCDPQGVKGGNLECNLYDGTCECREETAGRRCDECNNGYFRFPYCRQCTCDEAGSVPRICDPDSGTCMCKENVQGLQCQQCMPGTFYLESRNPKGCTKCFCFGLAQCQESRLRRSQVSQMEGWAITNVDQPDTRSRGGRVEVSIDPGMVPDSTQPHYWIAPAEYLGNKLTSYGGALSYTLRFEGSGLGDGGMSDVRIEGGGNTLITYYAQAVPNEGEESRVTIDMLETLFEHEGRGEFVTREEFMMTLVNIRSLQIRAAYVTSATRVAIADVSLDVASADGRGEVARNVEQCTCPPNYAGTSCERCAEGYYRLDEGLYLGRCVPCRCNGRSDTCDPDTGACTNCRDDFEGPQCLTCKRGFFYDEFSRTCKICSCPLPFPSNNFAASCEVSRAGEVLRCFCDDGYEAPDCATCSPGYWGEPTQRGGSCQPCDCNGNIDTNNRLSCDVFTGACLRCINDAAGERCEHCREWFYGDAIDLKNCQECNCNRVGAESCDDRNGVCLCKPNVVGPTCDRCDYGTFGFASGNGCQECACAEAVLSDQCDEVSGQCQCKPGVAGRRCDQCERGYFGYTADGCRKCDCTSEGAVTCDPVSGRCQCLPGVTGEKCDQCLPRWVLIPEEGCEACDNCVHTLLDDVDAMSAQVKNMTDQLSDVSVGQDAIRRLNDINDTVHQLRPLVDDLEGLPNNPDMLQPLKDDLKEVLDLSNEVRDKAHRSAREAEVVASDAQDVRTDAEDLADLVQMADDAARDAVEYANKVLEDIRDNIRDANVEELLRMAEIILEEIKNRDFNSEEADADRELREAIDALRRAQNIHRQASEQADKAMDMVTEVADLRDKLRDLSNSSGHTLDNAQAAKDMNAVTERTIEEIRFAADDAREKESMARDLLDKARQVLADAEVTYADVQRQSSTLDGAMDRLRTFVNELAQENSNLEPLVKEAMDHALSLRGIADGLDTAFAESRNLSEGAINASNAYKNIVKAIDEAYDASLAAKDAAEEAFQKSGGLAERARRSRERSEILDEDAEDAKRYITNQLRPRLEREEAATEALAQLNRETQTELDLLNAGLDGLPAGGFEQDAIAAREKAMDAQMRAEDARDRIRQATQGDLERAKELAQLIDDANMGVVKAQAQVDDVRDLIPDINLLLNGVEDKQRSIETIAKRIEADLSELREKITISRGDANGIEVGVNFEQDTVLQVRNPANIMDAQGYTKISLFFKTDEPNGFLAYLGPDAAQSTGSDYLALEVIDGRLMLKFDLGDGVVLLENPKQVNDGEWHEAIIERVGKIAFLRVRTQDEDISEVNTTTEYSTVLDLDPDSVKFYIGGVPDSAGLQNLLVSTGFKGCIEELSFDGVSVGLWNFVYGENNNRGCILRGADVLPSPPPVGFKFSGDGYIVLDAERFRPARASRVEFEFRTYAEDGLMFLIGEEDTFGDFFAVEMRDGRVLFQYDLGSGAAILESTQRFNDGDWHKLVANRVDKNGMLKVDDVTVAGQSRGRQSQLGMSQNVYIGGFPRQHNFTGVTNKRFEGCIQNVIQLGSNGRDIAENKVNYKVIAGCVDQARIVSFSSDVQNSYIAMDPVNVNSQFQMTMKLRTTENEGLIFYVTDGSAQQENAFSVVMKDGKIVLIATPEDGSPTAIETNLTYNDGEWHYIRVIKDGRDITLDVDDSEKVNTRYDGKKRIQTTSALFFGGVRPGMGVVLANTKGVQSSFYGCIGDVTINNQLVNFRMALNSSGIAFDAGKPTVIVQPAPIYPTLPPPVIPDKDGVQAQCALPRRPDISVEDPADAGTRFGATEDSRWEYDAVPAAFGDSSDFRLEFKTTVFDGLLFFASELTDFITLYMQDGRLYYGFNCGSGRTVMSTQLTYNDDQWHVVDFKRISRSGTLTVDGNDFVDGTAPGSSSALNVQPPFYVGGVGGDGLNETLGRIPDGLPTTFRGCIRDPQLNGIQFGAPDREYSTQPCTVFMEPGTFFRDGDGYLTILDNFNVGLDISISLEVKPRTMSGALLSVFNPDNGEYLVIQMVDGDVIFNVNNGEGNPELVTTYQRITAANLCDGSWHSITANKNKNLVLLIVDGYRTQPGIGVAGVSQTDTDNPLYIGGVPSRHKGIKTRENYVGCIRGLQIEGVPYSLSSGTPTDNVILDACPTN